MGSGRWDPTAWDQHAATTRATKPTVDHVYTARTVDPALHVAQITLRESRDSDANPNSTPLIVALDVTGSMDPVLDSLARTGLGKLVGEIYARKPISDPHVLLMGIGDVECDRAPVQATQFEAEVGPLTAQMEKLFLERGGGGNDCESYTAAWLFAAMFTEHDAFAKRGKRGYLFTVGDECPNAVLRMEKARPHFAETAGLQADLSARQLLDLASRTYEVFHVGIEQGNFMRSAKDRVQAEWRALLGQRFLSLADHTLLAETIVSAIQVLEGADRDRVVGSWDGRTSAVVAAAVQDLTPAARIPDAGLVRL